MVVRGRGPAPKLGEKLGHRAVSERRPVNPGDGQPKRWPIPEGDWCVEARRWWEAATSSLASEQAWLEEDRPKLERLLRMVDTWWQLPRAEQLRQADTLRRAEVELYLSPAERARAGLSPDRKPAETPVGSSARSRLQAAG